MPHARRLAALLAAPLLLLVACGDDQTSSDGTTTTTRAPDRPASTSLADVVITDADPPGLEFEQPFGIEETASEVRTEGDGRAVEPGLTVVMHFLFVNGRDGSTLDTSYGADPASIVFADDLMEGIFTGLNGVTAGSRVLIGLAPGDGFGADPASGLTEDDSLLFLADILEVRQPLARAEGEAVPPVEGLPTVELDDAGSPTITLPGGEPPAELVAQPLIVGSGAVVEAGQTITVHYRGVLWDGGEEFDASWGRAPASFSIGTGAVIAGWDKGLVGRTVGSQVLLVVPPADGYPEGSPDGSISGTDTLVFVVDILDAG